MLLSSIFSIIITVHRPRITERQVPVMPAADDFLMFPTRLNPITASSREAASLLNHPQFQKLDPLSLGLNAPQGEEQFVISQPCQGRFAERKILPVNVCA